MNLKMLNSEQNPEECDATKAQSRHKSRENNNKTNYPQANH